MIFMLKKMVYESVNKYPTYLSPLFHYVKKKEVFSTDLVFFFEGNLLI